MNARVTGGMTVASVLAFGIVAFGQSTAQQPTSSQAQPGASSSSGQQVTVVGCIQREADYRKAHGEGRGGAVGTGVGVGNEFILTDASMGSGAKTGAEPSTPTGTAGTAASAASAYELTGSNEGQASAYVGKRVEITGTLKAAETTATGQPTGGATAGRPPSGMDVASKDLKLRELEVTSVRESTGTCKPMK